MGEKILNIAKWIGGVIGGMTAVAGVVGSIYLLGQKTEQKKQRDSDLVDAINITTNKVDRLIKSDSTKTVQFNDILAQLKDQSHQLKTLNISYANHLILSKKLDEYIKYLEDEKKNVGTNIFPTVLKQDK